MGVKISNLPAIVTPALTDIFPVVQAGVTYKESGTQFASLFATVGANSSITSLTGLTGGILGTATNNNAAAGYVGEFSSSVIALASAVPLTTLTATNVTSLSLTAGDWDVWGNVGFFGDPTTTLLLAIGWISTTSAALPDSSLSNSAVYAPAAAVFAGAAVGFQVPSKRISIAGTTTVYLSVEAGFGTSTCGGYGAIYARRRR